MKVAVILGRQKGETNEEVSIENDAISAHLEAMKVLKGEINILQAPLNSITIGHVLNVKTRISHDEMFAIDVKRQDLVELLNLNALHSESLQVETETTPTPEMTEAESNVGNKRPSPITIGHALNVKIPTSHLEIHAIVVKQIDPAMLCRNVNLSVAEGKTGEGVPPHKVANEATEEVAFLKVESVDTKQVALLVEMVNEVDLHVMAQLHHDPLDLGMVNLDLKAKGAQEISPEEMGRGVNDPHEKLDRASHVQRIVGQEATRQILRIAKHVENGLVMLTINRHEISESPKNSNEEMMIEGIG